MDFLYGNHMLCPTLCFHLVMRAYDYEKGPNNLFLVRPPSDMNICVRRFFTDIVRTFYIYDEDKEIYMSSMNPFLSDIGQHKNSIGLKFHIPELIRFKPEIFTGTFKNEIVLETYNRSREIILKERFCNPQIIFEHKIGNTYNEIVIYRIKYSLSENFYK